MKNRSKGHDCEVKDPTNWENEYSVDDVSA